MDADARPAAAAESADARGAGEAAPVALQSVIAQLAALFLGLAILIVGSGLLGTLLGVRADIEDFAPATIGFVMAAYFVGFVFGAYYGPDVVARAGHIRAFTAMASIVSAAALVHAILPEPWVWMVLRVVTGFCFASLYLIAETWLNERSTVENRGRILSLYMITSFSALLAGQLLLTLADPAGFTLFAVASIAFSLALVPIAMTRTVAPAPSRAPRIPLGRLFRLAPLGAIGCLVSGVCLGAFWGLGPVFARTMSFDEPGIAAFMALTVLGGLLAQWPIGRASDRYDRRVVIAIVTVGAAAASGAVAFAGASIAALLAAAFAYGGLVFPLYSLSVAHANDLRGDSDIVALGSGLLLLYGSGAAIGPVAGGLAMELLGARFLYAMSAAILALAAAFAIYRTRRRPAVGAAEKEAFVVVPRTTPAAFELDPRGEPSPAPDEPEAS